VTIIHASFLPSDTGEHATRQIFQIFHIIGPISSSVPICTWPRISTFRPISPQRRSALDNENVFQEIRGYHLSVTASHFVVGFHNAPPTRRPASAGKTSVVTRNMQQPPVSCAVVSVLHGVSTGQGDFQAVSHIRIAPTCHVLRTLHLQRICIAANTAHPIYHTGSRARRVGILQLLLSSSLKGYRDGSCITF
jgi:hypothetical protein